MSNDKPRITDMTVKLKTHPTITDRTVGLKNHHNLLKISTRK